MCTQSLLSSELMRAVFRAACKGCTYSLPLFTSRPLLTLSHTGSHPVPEQRQFAGGLGEGVSQKKKCLLRGGYIGIESSL